MSFHSHRLSGTALQHNGYDYAHDPEVVRSSPTKKIEFLKQILKMVQLDEFTNSILEKNYIDFF